MKGKVKIAVKNRNVSFNFTLERNITILTGDSGTGKTKLYSLTQITGGPKDVENAEV